MNRLVKMISKRMLDRVWKTHQTKRIKDLDGEEILPEEVR